MMRAHHVAAALACSLAAVGTAIGAPGAPVDLKTHKPQFHWKAGPKGGHAIYDGPMLVADFYPGPKVMRGIGRPISLHNLRLIPGGPPAIANGESCGPLCLSWRKHLIFYMKIDELAVDDKDRARFKLYVKSHDVGLRADRAYRETYQPNNVLEESWLELTYDPKLPSYVFDVKTRMTVRPGREQKMISRDLRGLEFADILPAGCNVPLKEKQFHYYVYKGRDGVYYRLPHNRNRGPEKEAVLYARDGIMAFLLQPQHNPVIELVGDTGRNTFSEICWAMYDVHFKFSKGRELELLKEGKPLEAHFRFYSISEEAGRELLGRSVWDPKLQLPGARRPPLTPGVVNDFEPSPMARHPADCFASPAAGSECTWDGTAGYRSKGALSIHRDAPRGSAFWQAWVDPLHGSGLHAGGRYQVKAMVRTKDLTGGARLVWRVGKKDVQTSQAVSGTTDWAPVTLETGPVTGPAVLKLLQEGAGQTWFDDVQLTPIQ